MIKNVLIPIDGSTRSLKAVEFLNEILGKNKLDKTGESLYSESDPLDIFVRTESFFIEDKNGTRTFILELPFVKDKNEISVFKDGQDIIISWLNETRRFHFPEKLRSREISEYIYENGYLKIKMDYWFFNI